MKKIIIVFLLLTLIAHCVSSQSSKRFVKGTLSTGGMVSINIESLKYLKPDATAITKYRKFDSNLDLGYYLWNNISLGVIGVYNFEKTIYDFGSPNQFFSHNFLVGPMFRYSTDLGLFASTSWVFGLFTYGPSGDKIKWGNNMWAVGLGYSLKLNNSVAFEPQVSYNYLHKTALAIEEGSQTTKGLNIYIGLRVYFKTKNVE